MFLVFLMIKIFLIFYLFLCIAFLLFTYKSLIKEFKKSNLELKWYLWIKYFFTSPAIFVGILIQILKTKGKNNE
ncbi:hypothetical protein BKH42_08750 [Helicobacter sp. 13S00482-2]|uniref:hypothetical protein n=1 Tax=Helicobacter sp. 13S00482-2 TaxID=1476200 RepID=UPI000BA6904C|nr:hypothetical protein [Helicobacter sp. 13S00482-2]PAF52924.1 hypothetical protein BKH42_08750 [Helicobacter sp. 13S00482-2]